MDCRWSQAARGLRSPHDRGHDHRPPERALQDRRADHGRRRGGREFEFRRASAIVLCRCGHSRTKPFCDATHKRIGFVADDVVAADRVARRRSTGRVESRVPEARLDETESGLAPASDGWFVVNVRDASGGRRRRSARLRVRDREHFFPQSAVRPAPADASASTISCWRTSTVPPSAASAAPRGVTVGEVEHAERVAERAGRRRAAPGARSLAPRAGRRCTRPPTTRTTRRRAVDEQAARIGDLRERRRRRAATARARCGARGSRRAPRRRPPRPAALVRRRRQRPDLDVSDVAVAEVSYSAIAWCSRRSPRARPARRLASAPPRARPPSAPGRSRAVARRGRRRRRRSRRP